MINKRAQLVVINRSKKIGASFAYRSQFAGTLLHVKWVFSHLKINKGNRQAL